MNDPDPVFTWSNGIGDDLPELLWGLDGAGGPEDAPAAGPSGGLISLAFITAAVKRRAWLVYLTALLGLVIGTGLYVKYPPAYHATVSVLLVDPPNQDAATQIQNDQAVAASQPVAALAVKQLGLPQSAASFQAASTVAIITNNVLLFNVGAPSASDAMTRVTALANAFLSFRAQNALAAQKQQAGELDQQFSQAEAALTPINAQISQLPVSGLSPAEQARLSKLETERSVQDQIEQYATVTKATTQTTTSAEVKDSKILGTAIPLARSHVKGIGLYVVGGLVGGLAVGLAIVIIGALASDRLRRRDDIAATLGTPVRLSVGPLRPRRLPSLPRRAARRRRDLQRVVAFLRRAVPGRSRGAAGLVVVAVDNAAEVAPAVVSLAASCAQGGKQVVVADLAGGALARLLGAKGSGVHTVTAGGQPVIAVVPEPDDITPAGPLQTLAQYAPPSEALVAACASADYLLTLASLDPAFGGEHLATWATDAVAIVTAGRSSAERINAVGEMMRLARTRLDAVVVTGVEKSDESVGMAPAPEESAQVRFN